MKKMTSRRGFTLLELMIAVAILVVIIIATSQIFGTVGKVAALGEATADVLQEAAAIERQFRADIQRLSSEGIFAIRCVSVRNGIHFGAGGPLLNPLLPENAIIRADQLVFFTNGIQGIQTYRQGGGTNHKGQGTAARIYYGHAFQLPGAGAVTSLGNNSAVFSWDPIVDLTNPLVPWYFSTDKYPMVRTVFNSSASNNEYTTTLNGEFIANQPSAQEWLLARQAIVLVDDGGSEVVYLNDIRSAYTIADAVVRNGRVDAAASQLNDIRNIITLIDPDDPNSNFRIWNEPVPGNDDQRLLIADQVLFYPRAERVAPGMHRVDQALTNNVLGSGCSSFIVDWTYEDGVGLAESTNPFSPALFGVAIDSSREQPWFGLDADFNGDGNLDRGVLFYDADPSDRWWTPAATIDPENVEELVINTHDLQVYEAFFGYNQSQPLNASGFPDSALGYTPWPSAIRITMVLHDPKSKLENGRVVQFVINLPKRAQ